MKNMFITTVVKKTYTNLFKTENRKTPKSLDTRKIIVIILKFEQCGSTIEKWVQKMQTEWQTV